jgi:hypothetical protein
VDDVGGGCEFVTDMSLVVAVGARDGARGPDVSERVASLDLDLEGVRDTGA